MPALHDVRRQRCRKGCGRCRCQEQRPPRPGRPLASGPDNGLAFFLGGLGLALNLGYCGLRVTRLRVGALRALHALFCHVITSDILIGDGLLLGIGVLVLILAGDRDLPLAFFHAGALIIRLTVLGHVTSPRE